MSKRDVLGLREQSYDAGSRLAAARRNLDVATKAKEAARIELDQAGVAYEQATRKANELESASLDIVARGEMVKGFELLPVDVVLNAMQELQNESASK